jgi:hypothetical protein
MGGYQLARAAGVLLILLQHGNMRRLWLNTAELELHHTALVVPGHSWLPLLNKMYTYLCISRGQAYLA